MRADDLDLLARYARHGTEDAFAALVRRHSDLVYSVALRIVRSPHGAEEVAQSVFIELARHAKHMRTGVILSAWLYRVTRSKAVDAMRREARRQRREQAAVALETVGAASSPGDLEPLLDAAMDALTESDRAAVVLRFFERKSLSDVGEALGVSADAAQKRVSRAVEQLRVFFAKRGIAAGSAAVATLLAADAVKAAPAGLATGICAAVKASATAFTLTTFISTLAMTTTQKALVAVLVAAAAGFAIHQLRNGPEVARETNAGPPMGSALPQEHEPEAASGRHLAEGGAPKGGPRSLLKPRLDEAGKRRLQQDPGGALSAHATGDGEAWSHDDDDLLVAWAAQDPAAAMKWLDGGERAVVRSQLLGAVAAGILLRDGKEAMRRFLDEHQQDPRLRPKDQGELEKFLFYHLGREDTFDAAMEILRETKDSSMAGMMIAGIEGPQYQTNAIDYLETKGIPVEFDYWILQHDIGKDPRFWADWARQRDSDLLSEIVDGWARDQPDEAKAWVEERVPKADPRRAAIDERLELRGNPAEEER